MVSNEGRELNAHRIRKFKLGAFVDFFISSCFVHIRKPDVDIFRLALDIAQKPARQIVYIENTPMFVEIAEGWGSAAFCIRITGRPARNWLRSDCRTMEEPAMKPAESRILTINGGSSSIKFALFEAGGALRRILGGELERIGLPEASLAGERLEPERTIFRGR